MIADDRTRLLADQLLALLREHLTEPDLIFEGSPTRLTGGFWAELVSFRVAPAPADWNRPLVARVMPSPEIASKEAAFQHEVAEQGYPTPVVRLARGPEAGIDNRAVMIMDLAEGAPLLAGLDGLSAIAKLPSLARRLPTALADVLARLHSLDSGPISARLAATTTERPDIESMLRSLRASADALNRPALVAAISWLSAHRPPPTSDVICHGDMHPFNLLIDSEGDVTVLDWSAAVLAPRGYDLGFTSLMLAEPPLMVPSLLRPVIRRAGRTLSRRFVRSYERQAGVRVEPEALAWFQGLICVRALAEVASWAAAGSLADRRGHPWVINQDALIDRLRALTGSNVPAERG